MDPMSVMAIVATAGGPSSFVVAGHSTAREIVLSSSVLVQQVLVSAFLTGARVEIELVPGSAVVKRVHPFTAGNGPSSRPLPGGYRVSRMATQRMADGRSEHLEVFLVEGPDGPEKPYNVFDPLLQQLLQASFVVHPSPPGGVLLHVEFDLKDIATVRLGAP